jgi:hypothetical protein
VSRFLRYFLITHKFIDFKGVREGFAVHLKRKTHYQKILQNPKGLTLTVRWRGLPFGAVF